MQPVPGPGYGRPSYFHPKSEFFRPLPPILPQFDRFPRCFNTVAFPPAAPMQRGQTILVFVCCGHLGISELIASAIGLETSSTISV